MSCSIFRIFRISPPRDAKRGHAFQKYFILLLFFSACTVLKLEFSELDFLKFQNLVASTVMSGDSQRIVRRDELVVFTATWYESIEDVRCHQAVQTLNALSTFGLTVVVVDGSPSPEVRALLETTGALVYKQSVKGKKGAALREAATISANLEGVQEHTWLCWQEPEKTDMANHWIAALIQDISTQEASIVVPSRKELEFKSTCVISTLVEYY